MPVNKLSLNLRPTLILTLNDLEQAPLIMRVQVLKHDDCIALGVLAVDSSEIAIDLVRFHLLPF